jgi:dimethylamine monooxygenase subunit A
VIHTPYDGTSKPFTIGLKALDVKDWLDFDDQFDIYLQEKRRLYKEEGDHVLVAEQGSEAAQAEVLDLIEDDLRLRGRSSAVLSSDVAPLARAGLLVQEDLVLMRHSLRGWRLVAASLCFPSAWNLHEKFGKTMPEIHQPVPGFGEGTRNAGLIDRMFDNLRVEQPVVRWNWSLYGDDRLYHPASDNNMKNRFGEGQLDGKVIIRLERQTLRKLPQSGDILFTIRIYNQPLEVLQNHHEGPSLAHAIAKQLAEMTVEQQAYKGLSDDIPKLLRRLERLAQRSGG